MFASRLWFDAEHTKATEGIHPVPVASVPKALAANAVPIGNRVSNPSSTLRVSQP